MQTKQMAEWLPMCKLTGRILEVGSLNVNGTIRKWVDVTVGIDLRAGKGVDKVMDACDLPGRLGFFDSVVSVDALEHAQDWKGFVLGMWRSLRTGGKCALVACAPGKGRHDHPHDYWRFTKADFVYVFAQQEILDCRKLGCSTGILVRKVTEDLNLNLRVQAI